MGRNDGSRAYGLYLNQGMDKKEAMKQVAKDRGVGKRDIYTRHFYKAFVNLYTFLEKSLFNLVIARDVKTFLYTLFQNKTATVCKNRTKI